MRVTGLPPFGLAISRDPARTLVERLRSHEQDCLMLLVRLLDSPTLDGWLSRLTLPNLWRFVLHSLVKVILLKSISLERLRRVVNLSRGLH
jgi:hypothetical protein